MYIYTLALWLHTRSANQEILHTANIHRIRIYSVYLTMCIITRQMYRYYCYDQTVKEAETEGGK